MLETKQRSLKEGCQLIKNCFEKQVLKNRKIWKMETKELNLAFVSPESVYQATVPVEAKRFAKNNNK